MELTILSPCLEIITMEPFLTPGETVGPHVQDTWFVNQWSVGLSSCLGGQKEEEEEGERTYIDAKICLNFESRRKLRPIYSLHHHHDQCTKREESNILSPTQTNMVTR